MTNRKLGLGAIMMIALVFGIGVTPILLQQRSAYAWIDPGTEPSLRSLHFFQHSTSMA